MDAPRGGLWSMTTQILASLDCQFVKVEGHESDDPDGSDCLWITVEDSDFAEGDLITVSPLSQNRWYVAHDLAHKHGGWPTVWDFAGSDSEVLYAVSVYLVSTTRVRRT